jgi:zinc protease
MLDGIVETRLANGLGVVVQRVPQTSGAGVAVNYRVGFRTETPGRSGFAHLFEHMMFQGSRSVAKGEHFSRVLAHGGQVNGNTFPDVTDYHQVVPSHAVDQVLALEADRMAHLAVTQRNLDVQRDVVKEEIRLKVTGMPYGGFPWTVLPSVLYGKWENAHNGYGELDDLDAATIEDCADFYAAFYAPQNAVLAVCGDIDPQATLTAVERAFADVPARPGPPLPDLAEPVAGEPLTGVHIDALAPRQALAVGCRLPDPARDMRAYAAHVVLGRLLTSGTHARLRQAVVPLTAQVASTAGLFGPLMAADPDTFVIVVHHPHGAAERALAVVDRELRAVASGAASEREVQRAVASALTQTHVGQDSLATRVRSLARGRMLWQQPGIADALTRALAATDAQDIRAAAANLARPQGRAVLTLLPKESTS